jgi:hypothetical protein
LQVKEGSFKNMTLLGLSNRTGRGVPKKAFTHSSTGGYRSKENTCLELACILLSKELNDKKTRKKRKVKIND